MEVYIIPKRLTLMLQHDNFKSKGHADFTYFTAAALTGGRTNDNVDIGNLDNYRITTYMARLRYTATKRFIFTAGYVYEHYKYSDASYDNYALATGSFPPGNSSTALLTGAYANPNYEAHIGFLAVICRF
jgi:hypothetical protein